MQFWLEGAGLSPLAERWNQGFPEMVDSDSINKQGMAWEA